MDSFWDRHSSVLKDPSGHMSLAKRIFSSFVSLTMVVSTVGTGMLAMPGVASAATLVSGDLIKASGPAVYYYGSDARRYVFPNETTFFSWFQDFSSVKTITDSELAAISIGGNMVIRPGTKLVKITTDPKVYAVTRCGGLHWIESESVATSLYGSSWARRVVDVPDAFFTNYSVGPSLASAVHPDGTLVSWSGDSSRYVVWGGQKRRFNPDSAFAANGYNAANVIETTISYPAGSDVTARESVLADAVCTTGSTTPTPVSGNLMVSLASDTPASMTLPKGASSVQLAKYNLTAGSGEVRVTGLSVHRLGIGAVNDFSNVYLYSANGTRMSTGRTINSVTNNVDFNGLNLVIPAGQTVSVWVVGDTASTATAGGQHAFELVSAASVITNSTGTTIGGSFPVRGNAFLIGTTSAARLDVTKRTNPANPNVGAVGALVGTFAMTANTNDIEVRRVTLYQAGDIVSTDIRNFKLYQGSTLVATADAITGSNQIVLNFVPPYLIPNGVTRVFDLKADVMGRAGRSIKTYVEYSTDVQAIDRVYNSGVLVCNTTSTSSCSSSNGSYDGTGSNNVTSNYSYVATQGGQLTVAFNGPVTSNVARGQTGVSMMNFSLTSQSSNLEVRNMRISIASTNGGAVCSGTTVGTCGTTDYVRNVRVRDVATGQIVQGPTSASGANTITGASSVNTSSTFNFSNSVYLTPGQTRNFEVLVDFANDSAIDSKKYIAVLGGIGNSNIFGSSDVRVTDTGEFVGTTNIVPNSLINGNEMTVRSSSLVVGLASSPSSGSAVRRQAQIPAAGFTFTAGAQSDALITSVTADGYGSLDGGSTYTAGQLSQVVSSCALFDGTTQVGDARIPDSSTDEMTFSNLNFTVARGTTRTLTVKCTADTVVTDLTNGDKFAIGLTSVTAQDQDANSISASVNSSVSGNAASSGQSVVITVRNSGTLNISANNMRQPTILVAGGDTWQNLAEYRATAQYEDVLIERLIATTTGNAVTIGGIAVAKDGVIKGQDVLSSGVNQAKDIDMTASPIVVPKDSSVTFNLWAKINPVVATSTPGVTTIANRSGSQVAMGLGTGATVSTAPSLAAEYDSNYASVSTRDGRFNVRATGAASGERVYAATTTATTINGGLFGNTFVVRKSKPTVNRICSGVGGACPTSLSGNTELYRVAVSADAAGSVALKKITLSWTKSTGTTSGLTINNLQVLKGGVPMTQSSYSLMNQNGTDLKSAGLFPMVASSSGYIVISFVTPETITGTGNQYALTGDISGAVSGDTVTFGLKTTGNSAVTTGFLTSATTTLNSILLPAPNLSTVSTSASADAAGTFVWSDMSEIGGGQNTTGDWTDDLYVETLTGASQTFRLN